MFVKIQAYLHSLDDAMKTALEPGFIANWKDKIQGLFKDFSRT